MLLAARGLNTVFAAIQLQSERSWNIGSASFQLVIHTYIHVYR